MFKRFIIILGIATLWTLSFNSLPFIVCLSTPARIIIGVISLELFLFTLIDIYWVFRADSIEFISHHAFALMKNLFFLVTLIYIIKFIGTGFNICSTINYIVTLVGFLIMYYTYKNN